jgi:hypothetical protein
MSFVYEKASIECDGSEIISRKIIRGAAITIDNVVYLQYKCQQNSVATIEKELDPKNPRLNPYSHLNLGDSVKGEDLAIRMQGLKPFKIKLVNLTHTHKAQSTNSNCYTHAALTKPFPNIASTQDPKQVPPSPQILTS